jgi:DNA-binding IclR family transcriptional regulator
MSQLNEELIKIVNVSMPFPAEVIAAYSRLGMVFTSGELAKEANIPRSTAKFYVRKMLEMRMISKVPYKKKYQKYANAKNFSDWLMDLIKLAIRPLEERK